MTLNVIDVIILLILLAGAWQGFRRGMILTSGRTARLSRGHLAGRALLHHCGPVPRGATGPGQAAGRDTGAFYRQHSGCRANYQAFGSGSSKGFPPSLWVPVSNAQAGIYGSGMAQSLALAIVKVIAFLLIMVLVSYLVMIVASFLSHSCPLS